MEQLDTQQERILQELVAIGFAKVTDFLSVENGQTVLTDLSDPGTGAAIATVEVTGKGVKVKLYDKLKALELLGKHYGMFAGKPAAPREKNNLLEAILEATKEAVKTDDLPEIQQAAADRDELVEPAGVGGAGGDHL